MNRIAALVCAVMLTFQLTACSNPMNSNAPRLSRAAEADVALDDLYAKSDGARALAKDAVGVLVFPEITKAGLIVGGQFGKGVLFKEGRVAGYYNSVAASYGLQAGVQKFGYALFFMNEKDLNYLGKSDGWEVGVGPSITVVDKGFANSISTTTAREGVYAFFFEQRGLMAGIGIQGTKISKSDAD